MCKSTGHFYPTRPQKPKECFIQKFRKDNSELDFWLLGALQKNKNMIDCKNLLVVIISYQAELMLMSLINS